MTTKLELENIFKFACIFYFHSNQEVGISSFFRLVYSLYTQMLSTVKITFNDNNNSAKQNFSSVVGGIWLGANFEIGAPKQSGATMAA